MTNMTVNITEEQAQRCLINIAINENTIIQVEFVREDDSLYLSAWETANPDSDGVVENHYPEFFTV